MAASKSAARTYYWREYFKSSNRVHGFVIYAHCLSFFFASLNRCCKAIVIERLPSGVFADPFELQHLTQLDCKLQ